MEPDLDKTLPATQKIPAEMEIRPSQSEAYETIRTLCLGMPGVIEAASPGQTAFKVGQRSFVVIETFRDPTGKPFNCLAFKASFLDHERLARDNAFFPAPYLGGAGWLGRRMDSSEQPIDWSDMSGILGRSHRQIAGRGAYPSRLARGRPHIDSA